jgi:hypothetical protein
VLRGTRGRTEAAWSSCLGSHARGPIPLLHVGCRASCGIARRCCWVSAASVLCTMLRTGHAQLLQLSLHIRICPWPPLGVVREVRRHAIVDAKS